MESQIKSSNEKMLIGCREHLDRFFATYPNPVLEERAMKALDFLAKVKKPLAGKPEGWAAGMIYAVANLDRQACGVPGLLNSEFIEFFNVSMETVRKRAANVMNQISSLWFPTHSVLTTIYVCDLLRMDA
jgi:hypothetical protein